MLQRQSKKQHFSKQETEQNNYYLMILELENIWWSRSVKFTAQIFTRAWYFLAEFTLFLFFCLYIYPSDMKGFQ